MPIGVMSRAAQCSYLDFELNVTAPDPVRFGNFIPDELTQAVIEFDVDPSTIDTTVPVIIEFKMELASAGTKYIWRWKNAFPTTEAQIKDPTALDDATNQVAFTEVTGGTVSVDIAALIDDMVANSQTTVLLGFPDVNEDVFGHIENNETKPGLTYTLNGTTGGGGGGDEENDDIILPGLIKWANGILSRDGALANSTECCCCDCCGWNEEEGGPQLENFQIDFPSPHASATEGNAIGLPINGTGKNDCKKPGQNKPGTARFEFNILWTNACQGEDTTPAVATLYHKPPFPGAPNGCCYWIIEMEAPDALCGNGVGPGNIGDDWPGGIIIQANCQGRGLITCQEFIDTQFPLGNACAIAAHCDDGGFTGIDFSTNLLTDCYCRENEFAV